VDDLGIPVWAILPVALLAPFFAAALIDALSRQAGEEVTATTGREGPGLSDEERERLEEEHAVARPAAEAAGAEQGSPMGTSGIAH
jgi:hypothetical protein